MKTLTEFSGFVLKDAMTKKASLLTEGKTEEEAHAAVLEQLKLDEAKAGLYKNVVDMTSSRMDRVKRVVVALKSSETEKVPESYTEREGHFYLIEYFPSADQKGRSARSDEDDFRGGRRGGRRDDRKGRGGERGERRDAGRPSGRDQAGRPSGRDQAGRPSGRDHTPRPVGRTDARILTQGAATTEQAQARPPRGPRPPKAPRAPQGPRPPRTPRAPQQGPKGAGELRLVLKGQSETKLQGSAPAEAPATPVTSEAPSV